MKKYPFKVIIVGGSVAGLTLAHSLERAGIDYVVLERHKIISQHVGASVAIFPNGCKILAQLGFLDNLAAESVSIDRIHMSRFGEIHVNNEYSTPTSLRDRYVCFRLSRRIVFKED